MNGTQERPTPPPMPEAAPARVTLHTRIRPDLSDAIARYGRETGASKQAIIEHALAEYLTRRGQWEAQR